VTGESYAPMADVQFRPKLSPALLNIPPPLLTYLPFIFTKLILSGLMRDK